MIPKDNAIINNEIGCYKTFSKQKKSESPLRVPNSIEQFDLSLFYVKDLILDLVEME